MKFSEMPYRRVDMEQLKKDFAGLEADLDKAASGEEQFAVHQRFYQLTDRVMTEMTIAQIRHDADMTDERYEQEHSYYDEMRPVFSHLVVSYQKKLSASRFRPYLETRIGRVAFTNMELAERSVDERILPLMREENQLQSRYNKLLATARIEWEGESLNLSLMNPYLCSESRPVRGRAWEAYTRFFSQNKEELDEIFDLLVKNRTAQARELGGENYLTLGYCRMRRNCYGQSEIAQLRRQVKQSIVPFSQMLHERRRRRLGLDKLLYIDEGIYFAQGNPKPVGTPQQILEAGRRMYRELSPETGRFMDFMCENELFDVLGRRNKKTGGYMDYLPEYHAPFIFANFNGTSADVDVITHECGHAFQGYLSGQDPIREHADVTMETAETHSMSMEFFTEPWMKLFFGARGQDYNDMHLEEAVNFIPYGTMVDEFQDIVYSEPSLTPGMRDQVWRDLERQYKPHLDYSGNEFFRQGGFWQKQHHIYDCPLYYIDYCIAGLNALQYKIWMDRDYPEAWQSYLKLCRLSASDYFTALVPQAGLTVPFEDGCVAYIVRKLRETVE